MKTLSSTIALLLVLIFSAETLRSAENHWTGSGGDSLWSNPSNWSLGTVPGSEDDVFIDAATPSTVEVDVQVDVQNVTIGNPAAVQTLTGGFDNFMVDGQMFVASNAVLALNTASLCCTNVSVEGTWDWSSGSVASYSVVTISASGKIEFGGTAEKWLYGTINNFGVANWNSVSEALSGFGTFNNIGTFVVHTNCALALSEGGAFNNIGTILRPEQSGTATLAGGFLKNTGILQAGINSTLRLEGSPFAFNDGSVIGGDGTVELNGSLIGSGTVTINGTLEMLVGASIAGTNTWTGPGKINWINGRFGDGGESTLATDFHLYLIGDDWKAFGDHTLNNFGTVVWNHPSAAWDGIGGIFNNFGSFILQTNCWMNGGATFNNHGTILRSGQSGTATLSGTWTVNNTGALQVETNSTLVLEVSPFAFNDGSVIEGDGTVQLNGYCIGSGIVTIDGTLELLLYSSIAGTNTWTGPGKFNWINGGFGYGGESTLASDLHLYFVGDDWKFMQNHTLNNFGTVIWNSPTASLDGYDSTFNNFGTFIVQTNCFITGNGTFNNSGTLLRPAQSGTATMGGGCLVNNTGALHAGTNSTLVMEVGQFAFNDGSIIEGDGTVQLSGSCIGSGTVTINGTVEMLVGAAISGTNTWTGPGRFNWINGAFGNGGESTLASDLHLYFVGDDWKFLVNHTLNNFGTVSWNSPTASCEGYEGIFNNFGTFIIQTNCSTIGSGAFNNSGTIVVPENSGAVVWSGGLNIINSGVLHIATNAILYAEIGPIAFNDGTIIEGDGRLRIDGYCNGTGTVTVNGTADIWWNGVMAGTNTWTGPGVLNWVGGWVDGGEMTLASDFHLNFVGFNYMPLGILLNNFGTVTWDAQWGIWQGQGGTFNNMGTFIVQTNCWMEGGGTFNNNGTIQFLNGATTIDWIFDNQGTLELQKGSVTSRTLNFSSGSTNRFVISGPNPTSDFGQLNLGEANFAGTLAIALTNGFVPTNQSTFALVNYTNQINPFTEAQFPASEWAVVYGATSLVAEVVFVAPVISGQPISQTVDYQETATFNVTATGTELLSYQWYSGNSGDTSAPITAATNSIYTTPALTTSTSFWVRVSNAAGTTDSTTATATIFCTAPLLIVQPQSQTVFLRGDALFTASVSGCTPLTLQWQKNGVKIKGATNSTLSLTSVATTAIAGYTLVASNIAGVVTSSVANLTIVTDFSQLVPLAGKYNGLFHETNSVKHESSGLFTLTLKTNATFTGKIAMEGDAISFSGKMTPAGTAAVVIKRASIQKSNVTANLIFDLTGGSDVLTGTVSGLTWSAPLKADRDVWFKNQEATAYTNYYTMLLPGFVDSADGPSGYSYGTVTIKTNGVLTFGGVMADNRLVKQTVPISKQGLAPIYVPLYPVRRIYTNLTVTNVVKLVTNRSYYLGSVLGWLAFTNSTPTGMVSWVKTGWTNTVYPNGFTNTATVLGSLYTPPATGTRAIDLTAGTISLSGGNLSSTMTRNFSLSTLNKFTVTPAANLVTLTLTPRTGVVKGSFVHSATSAKTNITGVILQQQQVAGGYFLGTNEAGAFLLQGN